MPATLIFERFWFCIFYSIFLSLKKRLTVLSVLCLSFLSDTHYTQYSTVKPASTTFSSYDVVIEEEGFIQKARQTVVISVWGARSYAELRICGLNVRYCVHHCCTFPFTFVGGGEVLCRFVFQT